MNNRAKIDYDGINLYITLRVKNKRIAKILLLIGVLLLFSIVVFISTFVISDDDKSGLFPIIMIFFITTFFPLKYLFWNLYGSEHLIINTKSISYYYHYGFIETKLRTIHFNILSLELNSTGEFQNIERGQIVFLNFRENDHLQEIIHQTTVLVDFSEIERIDKEIRNLFENHLVDKSGFIGYSLN